MLEDKNVANCIRAKEKKSGRPTSQSFLKRGSNPSINICECPLVLILVSEPFAVGTPPIDPCRGWLPVSVSSSTISFLHVRKGDFLFGCELSDLRGECLSSTSLWQSPPLSMSTSCASCILIGEEASSWTSSTLTGFNHWPPFSCWKYMHHSVTCKTEQKTKGIRSWNILLSGSTQQIISALTIFTRSPGIQDFQWLTNYEARNIPIAPLGMQTTNLRFHSSLLKKSYNSIKNNASARMLIDRIQAPGPTYSPVLHLQP